MWTPDPTAGGLPVFVWIHGGSFVNGSGAVPAYDGTPFARDGVVLVTINYRLGAEGFMTLAGAPDNRGLLDQIAALEWVGENIAAFGGDPGNITIAGESAGAMSVAALLASPRATGLFRRAVAAERRGPPRAHGGDRRQDRRRRGRAPGRRADARGDCRGRSWPGGRGAAVGAAGGRTMPDPAKWGEAASNLMAFEPVIDDDIVPELPFESIAGGAGKDVDLIVGATTEEMRFFLVPTGAIDLVNDDILRGRGRPPTGSTRMPDSPPTLATARAQATRSRQSLTDWFFRIPALRLAETAAARGDRAYVYEFAWRSPAYDGRWAPATRSSSASRSTT